MPIFNAKDRPLASNSGTVPDVSDAMLDWFQKITFSVVTKEIVDFKVVETATDIEFLGVWQPFTAQQLVMKPEGQRDWKWFTVHAQVGTPLSPDDCFVYLGTQYRVAAKLDYNEYGYIEYHIVQDYTGSGPTR